MKKLILMGRVAAGKTTLTQALRGEQLHYCKTQYVRYHDTIIDTPGEYTEIGRLGAALQLYAYEADIVALVIRSDEPFCVFPPAITGMVNREVIGIVSAVDREDGNPERAERWLRLCGCKRIFRVSSKTGKGLDEVIAYLNA